MPEGTVGDGSWFLCALQQHTIHRPASLMESPPCCSSFSSLLSPASLLGRETISKQAVASVAPPSPYYSHRHCLGQGDQAGCHGEEEPLSQWTFCWSLGPQQIPDHANHWCQGPARTGSRILTESSCASSWSVSQCYSRWWLLPQKPIMVWNQATWRAVSSHVNPPIFSDQLMGSSCPCHCLLRCVWKQCSASYRQLSSLFVFCKHLKIFFHPQVFMILLLLRLPCV